jgi:hypothetical protein
VAKILRAVSCQIITCHAGLYCHRPCGVKLLRACSSMLLFRTNVIRSRSKKKQSEITCLLPQREEPCFCQNP